MVRGHLSGMTCSGLTSLFRSAFTSLVRVVPYFCCVGYGWSHDGRVDLSGSDDRGASRALRQSHDGVQLSDGLPGSGTYVWTPSQTAIEAERENVSMFGIVHESDGGRQYAEFKSNLELLRHWH